MNVYIKKRYPGHRYEYLIFVTYKMTDIETNQKRKRDISALFKKGKYINDDYSLNYDVFDPKKPGPLFNNLNIANQWFWSTKSISIIENNTHISNDHLMKIISYLSPLPFNAYLYCDINSTNENTYKIYTLNDVKIYKDSTNKSKQLLTENPYSNYYLFKLPPGKRIIFSAETEFNKPYIYKSEYLIDAQLEIKEIILFDVIDKSMLKLNPEQKFIYTDIAIRKDTVLDSFKKDSQTCVKFRRPHIIHTLPSFETEKKLYDIMKIDKDMFYSYFERLYDEDNLSFIEEDSDTNIIIGYSIVGSSIYTINFLLDSFTNLRRNMSNHNFNDSEFITDLLNMLINNLENIKKTNYK